MGKLRAWYARCTACAAMPNKPIALLPLFGLVLAAGCLAAEPTATDEAGGTASPQQATAARITPRTFPPSCGPVSVPCIGSAALSSTAHASLTYSSSCVTQCELSWDGGSEAWPAGTAGTTGAVPGLTYTLTCGLVTGGCTAFLVSGTATVL